MSNDNRKPIANPSIVLREEFDDWAILFDPDGDEGFGLNPVSTYIWKRLDGKHTLQDILKELRQDCDDIPDNAEEMIAKFINDLVEGGLAGYKLEEG